MGFTALHAAQHLQLSAAHVQLPVYKHEYNLEARVKRAYLSPQLQVDTPQAPAWLTGFWIICENMRDEIDVRNIETVEVPTGDIVNWC